MFLHLYLGKHIHTNIHACSYIIAFFNRYFVLEFSMWTERYKIKPVWFRKIQTHGKIYICYKYSTCPINHWECQQHLKCSRIKLSVILAWYDKFFLYWCKTMPERNKRKFYKNKGYIVEKRCQGWDVIVFWRCTYNYVSRRIQPFMERWFLITVDFNDWKKITKFNTKSPLLFMCPEWTLNKIFHNFQGLFI